MADPSEGSLFNPDFAQGDDMASRQLGYVPKPLQPGGPYTPVTAPTQKQGELIGPVYPGCGHSNNSIEVISAAVGGVQSAILRCTMCGYVARIITPFSAIYSLANSILFV